MSRPFRRPVLRERPLHLSVASFLTVALKPPYMWWHTPNGEKRDKATAGLLKAMGTKAGLPDFFAMRPPGSMGTLATATYVLGVELKAEDGRLSAEQRELHAALDAVGVHIEVCRSLADVERALVEHGFHLSARVMAGGGFMKDAA